MTARSISNRIYRRVRQLTRLPPEALRSLLPSFSQFGEDHALLRLLRPQADGTFVDVGANDPLEGSNTAFLYSLGWSGLAIDPNPQFAAKFKKARPRDIYLTMGVAERPTSLTYYEFEYNKFNTFSEERARRLVSEGNPLTGQQRVECRSLREIVREYLPGKHIDVLSVDCEGLDLDVLRSARLEEMRPTVLIVEDFEGYSGFQAGRREGALDEFLRAAGYLPICQLAWSAIYVAKDWRSLPRGAFDFPDGPGYMP